MPRGWGSPGTATMVRDHLVKVGQDSVYGVWLAVKGEVDGEYRPPSYQSMTKLFSILRRLGLIEKVGEEPIRPPRAGGKSYPFDKRSIHRIRPGREHAEEWENPVLALYQPDKFKQTRLFEPNRFIESTLPKMRDGYRKWKAEKTKHEQASRHFKADASELGDC